MDKTTRERDQLAKYLEEAVAIIRGEYPEGDARYMATLPMTLYAESLE